MTRLIANIVCYNDEKFIGTAIDDLVKRVRDLDVIEILDGAWQHGGETAQSTDKTKEIVELKQKQYRNRVDIEFRQVDFIFENEAHKRNYQLELVQEIYGYEPYWIFVFDSDEQIGFPNGMTHIYLKDYLGNMRFMAMLTSYAVDSPKPMYGIRFIPGGFGYHYHTERSMTLHSDDCKSITVDYNLSNQKDLQENLKNYQVFHMSQLYIINYWPQRDKERMRKKAEYLKHQESEVAANNPCRYPQRLLDSAAVDKHVQNSR